MDIKTAFKVVSFIFTTICASAQLSASPPPPLKTVLITQITEHPSADAVHKGILAALKDGGFVDGKNMKIIFENAQGSTVTALQIAQKFVSLQPDLMIPITTLSTQALVKANEDYSYPIVFAAVTDPVASGIVRSLEHPGGVVTGVTDSAPIKQQFEVFKRILPHLKTLGIIYNPGDNSSVTPVKEAQELAKEFGLTLVEATAIKTADVPGAMQQLAGKEVDAVFVPLDNTVLAAMDTVLRTAFEFKIPVFTSDSDSVSQGALASSGYTHFDTGYTAGQIAIKVLGGANPGDIPVATAHSLNVYINVKSANKLGVKFSDELLKTAKHM